MRSNMSARRFALSRQKFAETTCTTMQRLQKVPCPACGSSRAERCPTVRTPKRFSRRCLRQAGVDADIGELVMEVHEYDHYTVDMRVYRCEIGEDQVVRCMGVADARWVSPGEFAQYEFPGADEETISQLLDIDLIDDQEVN